MDVRNVPTPEMRPKARRILQEIARNADLVLDERVLAWAKLKAWGHGQDFACCRVRDLQAPRANVIEFDLYCSSEDRKEKLTALQDEFIVASQQQCALDLDVPVSRVRAAAARLVKRGLLTTQWVQSRALVTKHKLGKGLRARLVHMWVRAFYPVHEVEQ